MMWEKVKIGDVYEGLYDGPHATPPTSDDGAIFLGISNITKDGHIYITEGIEDDITLLDDFSNISPNIIKNEN